MLVRADVKCYLCGHVSGQLELEFGESPRIVSFLAAPGSEPSPPGREGRLRCARCGGGVFLDDWETVRPVEVVSFGPAKRGRPRKHPLPAAS